MQPCMKKKRLKKAERRRLISREAEASKAIKKSDR